MKIILPGEAMVCSAGNVRNTSWVLGIPWSNLHCGAGTKEGRIPVDSVTVSEEHPTPERDRLRVCEHELQF